MFYTETSQLRKRISELEATITDLEKQLMNADKRNDRLDNEIRAHTNWPYVFLIMLLVFVTIGVMFYMPELFVFCLLVAVVSFSNRSLPEQV